MELDDLFSVRNLFWLGNYEACVDEAEQVVPSNDREQIDRDVFVYRAYIAQGKGAKVTEAVGDQASAATDVLAVKLLATMVTQPQQAEAALETVKEWLNDETSKDNQMLQLMAGLMFFRAGDTKEALRSLRTPANLEQCALRVDILLSMNRTDLATTELRRMQDLDDDSTLTQLAMARIYLSSGGSKYQEAAYIFQEQIDKSVSSALLLNSLGVCYMQMKQFEEAEKHLLEAHAKDGSDPDVLVNLLSCFSNQRKPAQKSEPLLAKLRQVAPGHAVLQQLDQCSAVFQKIAAAQASA